MSFGRQLAPLRSWWWVIALGGLLGAAVAYGVVALSVRLYTTETQFFVSTTASQTAADAFQGSQFSQARATSYAHLLTGSELATRVSEALPARVSPDVVSKEISASVVPNTVLISVSVTDPSAQRAQQIAEVIGEVFPVMIQELEATGGADSSPVKVTVTEAPRVPTSPSYPKPVLDVLTGLLLGLVVGVGAAVARDRLDRSVKSADQISELSGLPAIGSIPRDDWVATKYVATDEASPRVIESFRHLRANLQYLDVDHPPRVIMISSPMPAEGKTTVVINLAATLAETGSRVAVVEGDLRRPRLSRYLGMVGDVGLTNVLAGSATASEVAQTYAGSQVELLAAGPVPPNPGQLLSSAQMSDVIRELRKSHDYVLVDAPPLLPVADALGLAVLADGVLLVVRYGRTQRDQLKRATEAILGVGARGLGVILNVVPPRGDDASRYGYKYGYSEDVEVSSHRRHRAR